jgi:hypothetical protein
MRDEFATDVKRVLAARAGHRCSKLNCRAPTAGPQIDSDGAVNVGVAAHITAASEGGPRYDRNMSNDERMSAANGIWLCQTCAKRIDSDPDRYSVKVLRAWKWLAEGEADEALGRPEEFEEPETPAPVDYPDIYVEQMHPGHETPLRAAEHFTVWAHSDDFALANGTIDPTLEARLSRLISRISAEDANLVLDTRRATYVFFGNKSPDLLLHRRWGFWADGFLALSSTLRDHRSPSRLVGESGMYSVADLALDLMSFCLVAGALRKDDVDVELRFVAHPFRLHPNLSPSHPQVRIARLGGVKEPMPRPQLPENVRELDRIFRTTTEQLREVPEAISAKLVTFMLRDFHEAWVDENQLSLSLERLMETVAAARAR